MLLLLSLFLADTTSRPAMISVAPSESLWVADTGTGEPVVLIPGLFGSGYEFRQVVPRLVSMGRRAIVIEPLGVGRSGRTAGADYSLAAQASRIAAALDSLHVSGAVVVAHSVASSIALRLALQRPDLVGAVVSLEGGVAESATTPGFRRALKFAPLLKLFGLGMVRGKIRKQLIEASGNPSWVTDSVVREYTVAAARDLGATLRAYQAMGRSVEPDSLAPRLPRVSCPVLLVLGAAPHASGPPPGEVTLLESIPVFATDAIPGVGHFPQEEAPEAVAAAVDRVSAATLAFRLLVLR
jgi:pimeloyl-ACP methyl ester carboxylesterase